METLAYQVIYRLYSGDLFVADMDHPKAVIISHVNNHDFRAKCDAIIGDVRIICSRSESVNGISGAPVPTKEVVGR